MASRLGREVAVRQMWALLNYRGFPGNLREIVCPTVLICGDEDQRTPVAIHQEMAEQISGSQLRVIDRYGHFTPLEQPAAVADALPDWLRMPLRIRAERPVSRGRTPH
jgi:pimeloyl-ACP methyl ester carboxylesterase